MLRLLLCCGVRDCVSVDGMAQRGHHQRRLSHTAQHLLPTPTGTITSVDGGGGHGVFYDRGAAVTGGWLQGAWASHDYVRGIDLLWGGEMGQEGAILFAVNVTGGKGEVVEEHQVGCREYQVQVDHSTGTVRAATRILVHDTVFLPPP